MASTATAPARGAARRRPRLHHLIMHHRQLVDAQIMELLAFMDEYRTGMRVPVMREHLALLMRLRRRAREAEGEARRIEDSSA